MKLSQFNIIANHKENVVVFNTLNNSFLYLNKHVYDRLYDLNYINRLPEINPDLYEKLCKSGVIIDSSFDEYGELLNRHQQAVNDRSVYDLTLLPSLDCNLRCWYCFEKHAKGTHLSKEMRDRIVRHIDWVLVDNPNTECLQITLFGGEPLLFFEEEIYPLLKAIQGRMNAFGKKFRCLIVTNGVRISPDNIALFSDLNASFQISIDGCKENHDKVKFVPSTRQGTYDHVIRMVNLLNKETSCFINLRINYNNRTLERVTDIMEDLKEVDKKKLRIHLERVWQTNATEEKQPDVLKEVIDTFLLNGFYVSYMGFNSNYGLPCKTSKRYQAVISHDGRVYKCTGRDFTEDLSEGILLENGKIQWDEKKLNKRMSIMTFEAERCQKCQFLPLCWGPCNQKILEAKKQGRIVKNCALDSIELSMNDYILYRFNNYYLWKQKNEIR